MAVITASYPYPYPYHRAVLRHNALPQQLSLAHSEGTFQNMAVTPVTSDKYLCELLPILGQYHRQVMNKTFTMIVPMRPPMTKIVYLPPEILMEWISMIQAFAATLPSASPRERPQSTANMTIQNVLQNTEVIAHHSSILIHTIKGLLSGANLNKTNLDRLRELKIGLMDFNIFLEKIIMYYTFLPTINQPPMEDLRQAINRVKDIMRVMKADTLHKFFAPYNQSTAVQRFVPSLQADLEETSPTSTADLSGNSLDITQDDILCSLLGMNEALARQLSITPEEERAHRTDKYLAAQMLEDVYDIVVAESLEDVESRFVSLIFNDAKADIFSGLLKNLPGRQQQSVLYWGKRFIENEFEYDILLNEDARPLNPHSGDMVVSTACRVTDETGVSPECRVPTTYAQSRNDLDTFISKCSDGKGTVFFHGTDAMSGRRIVENGIMLGKGNPQQDFSDGCGFYVTKDAQVAFDWAQNGNFAPCAAVLAFKVPAGVLEQHSKLDLTVDMETWRRIVNYNRCGRDRTQFKIPASLKKTYQKADFVEGKACNLETAEVWPQAELVPGDNTQLCILTDRMADIVGDIRNISVFFFDKSAKL